MTVVMSLYGALLKINPSAQHQSVYPPVGGAGILALPERAQFIGVRSDGVVAVWGAYERKNR